MAHNQLRPEDAARAWLESAADEELERLGLDGLSKILASAYGPGAAYPFAEIAMQRVVRRVVGAAAAIGALRMAGER
jgi:hypothetical protein